jgi:hypothetical protein
MTQTTKTKPTTMTQPATPSVPELVETLRKLAARLMSHESSRELWSTAAKILRIAAKRLSETQTLEGRWILIDRWQEQEGNQASALRELAMAKRIAIRVRASLLDNEEPHFRDLEHLERTICAIDALERHPRYTNLPAEPLPASNAIQPA